MTDDKKKSELEKLKLYPKIGSLLAIALAYGGLGIMGISALIAAPMLQLADPDHLTDPTIPYNEMENATYTWTAEEILGEARGIVVGIFFGCGLVLGGLAMSCVIPSEKRLHRVHCSTYVLGDAQKYCPECGIKLSRLEKD